jgi:hypothetical protein
VLAIFRVVSDRLGQSFELPRLHRIIRETHLGFALSHSPDRGGESTRVCLICPLAKRPEKGEETRQRVLLFLGLSFLEHLA